MNKVITIGRELGSGGRELGRRLAEKLGFAYYDNEIITEIAKRTSLSEEYVRQVAEKRPISPYPIHIATSLFHAPDPAFKQSLAIFSEQHKLIKGLYGKSDCVIVGRCADYILRGRPDVLDIFIHADYEHRAARVLERYGETNQPLKKRLQEKDSKRKVYYKHYTNRNWGEAENYDICLDSGKLGVDKCVEIVCDIAEMA